MTLQVLPSSTAALVQPTSPFTILDFAIGTSQSVDLIARIAADLA